MQSFLVPSVRSISKGPCAQLVILCIWFSLPLVSRGMEEW